MENSNQFKTAMITGATGYVAGWIVKRLLNEGYTVHARSGIRKILKSSNT